MKDEMQESKTEPNGAPIDSNKQSEAPQTLKKFRILEWWGRNDSRFVALGTLLAALATALMTVFTWCSIDEARKMREETKRLVDLTVEDFKIRAYPSFLIEFPSVNWKENELYESIKIHNKGEITAHNFTVLMVRVFLKSQQNFLFEHDLRPFYKGEEFKTTMNYPTKVFKDAFKFIESKQSIGKNDPRGNLTYLVFYIRFKIPLDSKYYYETFGFLLKEHITKKEVGDQTHFWQEIDNQLTSYLVKMHLETINKNFDFAKAEEIKSFLAEYPGFN
jgi:hypothetical protein